MTEPPPDDSADLASLQMENELLSVEVGHLRARLKTYEELDQSVKSCRDDLARARRRLQELRERHEVVLRDIHALVRGLDSSPAGIVLRRRKTFGQLLAKYGGEPPT